MDCVECGRPLPPKRLKFCCRSCNNKFHSRLRSTEKIICVSCKRVIFRRIRQRKFPNLCSQCIKHAQCGKNSPTWKGGCHSWKKGRWGIDKNGLSWKKQRKLCWERDGYTCQKCGKKKLGWKPDCHHIIPYRLSKSHDLSNLLSLCKKCHKKEDLLFEECPPAGKVNGTVCKTVAEGSSPSGDSIS